MCSPIRSATESYIAAIATIRTVRLTLLDLAIQGGQPPHRCDHSQIRFLAYPDDLSVIGLVAGRSLMFLTSFGVDFAFRR